jgi:hypothetical protein
MNRHEKGGLWLLFLFGKGGGMNKAFTKEWWAAAGMRALRTVAQTAIATIGTAVVMSDVNWLAVLSASLLSGILSMLMSIAGLPELEDKS